MNMSSHVQSDFGFRILEFAGLVAVKQSIVFKILTAPYMVEVTKHCTCLLIVV